MNAPPADELEAFGFYNYADLARSSDPLWTQDAKQGMHLLSLADKGHPSQTDRLRRKAASYFARAAERLRAEQPGEDIYPI